MAEKIATGADRAATQPRGRRKIRADGQRNYDLLIRTAKAAFAEIGPEVHLKTIAERAGVGIGTLYRHFPAREDLIEAVCRSEVEHLAEAASELLEKEEPVDALHKWMRLFVGYTATKKVLASIVMSTLGLSSGPPHISATEITDNPVFGASTEVYHSSTQLIKASIFALTEKAIAAGQIREDVTPMDLIRAITGFTITYDGDQALDWEEGAMRLIDILVDGLKAGKAST
ncbi:MAG: TetR/AcrR family transcriptional regulator [Novosphingobium sp.]|nr:TetR/AcrR family transcriptional regulator [Novosphingobium sp.]MCP5403729.1 TetR/AcrR family transcriptional regulator [Novosphingobium sp.]